MINIPDGYILERERYNEELGGTLYELEYLKTGTPVLWIDNGELNKTFSVAFKTLPEDNTGVFHILEHAVLGGSEKYPVKEPFVEILKGSMNTYLNAMTFSDKTVFPISSRNTKDFLNLTSVYLDAVFAPKLLTNDNIFYQEGWHLEQDEDGNYFSNGVVLNEMRGAMNEEDDYIYENLKNLLFKDNCYGYCSGGYPEEIPELSLNQFRETYRKYYHPSNAKIFLDGSVPLYETLTLISSYLNRYEKREDNFIIEKQIPEYRERTLFYNLDEDDENMGHLSIGKILCDWDDEIKPDAVNVLNDVIFGSNDSPVKKVLLKSGLCQDVSVSIDYSLSQPYLFADFRCVKDGKEKELLGLLCETARSLAVKGLDRKALEATINRFEFSSREVTEPAGVERAINCLNGWIYGGDPLRYITYSHVFSSLRDKLEGNEYENLLAEIYGNMDNAAVLVTLPNTDETQRREDIESELANRKALETGEEKIQSIMETLSLWQYSEDTAEDLAAIPQLSLDEIDRMPPKVETVEIESNSVKGIYHPIKSNGITYLTLLFRLTDFTLEELSLLSKVCALYTSVPTGKHSSLELQQEVQNLTGSLNFGVDVTSVKLQNETCTPWFLVKCRMLDGKVTQVLELIKEILFTSDFSDDEKIKEYIAQAEDSYRTLPQSAGHTLAINYCLACGDSENAVRSYLSGFDALSVLKNLASDEAAPDKVRGILNKVKNEVLYKNRMFFTCTGDKIPDISSFTGSLNAGKKVAGETSYKLATHKNAGFRISSHTGFAAQAYVSPDAGKSFHASLRIAANIVSLGYLWNEVRVRGGAYDTQLSTSRAGITICYSYRDPDPLNSLKVNKGIGDFIEKFCESDEELDKYIISGVSSTEPLQSPAEAGSSADLDYLNGYTYDEDVEDRKQMLETTKEKLLETIPFWNEFFQKAPVCIVGDVKMENDIAI